MFDTKAPRPVYDKLNSVISQQNKMFYGATTVFHMLTLGYASFFFRYRKLSALPVFLIGNAYYCMFENINNIFYKVIVDRKVIQTARNFGQEEHIQPTGSYKARDITFK